MKNSERTKANTEGKMDSIIRNLMMTHLDFLFPEFAGVCREYNAYVKGGKTQKTKY